MHVWRMEEWGFPHSIAFSGDAPILSQDACHFNTLSSRCLIRTHRDFKGDETWDRPSKRHGKTARSPSISRIRPPTLDFLTTPKRLSSLSWPFSSLLVFSSSINRPAPAAGV